MANNSSRGRAFPTEGQLKESPALHFHYYSAKIGKGKELLEALVRASEAVKKENGVELASIFELVHGDGPTYLLTLKLANPGVLAHLRRQTHLTTLGAEISGLAERVNHVTFSQRAQDRLG
jgi:hypothetical protein